MIFIVLFPSLLFLLFYWLFKKLIKLTNYMMRINAEMVRAKKVKKEKETKEESTA